MAQIPTILIRQDGIVKIQFLHSVSICTWEQSCLEIQMPSLWEIPVFDIYFISKKNPECNKKMMKISNEP